MSAEETKHTEIKIQDVQVLFPHRPYELQLEYMKRMIVALQEVCIEMFLNSQILFVHFALYFVVHYLFSGCCVVECSL